MLKIDNSTYNIPVIELERRADFLDKFAERTEDGALKRELIGVYFNYKLSLGSSVNSSSEYQRLWLKLSEPVEFHDVTVPDGAGEYTFSAYFSNVQDRLIKDKNGKTHWVGLTVNFISEKPARTA